jgi:type VI secretion system secreted protein Hcp
VKSGADGKPYLVVDFKEIFVTSVQISASSEVPMVSVSFSYNEIKVDYSAQTEDGTIASTGAVTYNTKTNTLS